MDFNKKDCFSYLDDVPVKISSKFLPPRIIALPLTFDAELPEDLLREEYDFSLERKVLELEKKRKAELNSVQENSSDDGSNQNNAMGNDPSLKRNSSHMPWQSDIILQPKPQQQMDKVSNEDAKDHVKKINLSDFENDTSSPFDYMELQTINDLEELNNVFQGLNSNLPATSEGEVNIPGNSGDKNEPPSNVSKSISFPLPQNSMLNSAEKLSSTSCGDFAYNSCSASSKSNSNTSFSNMRVLTSPNETRDSKDLSKYSALFQVPYVSSYAPKYYLNESSQLSSKSVLRGCKSYSDIHTLSETGNSNCREQERSRTPPSMSLATDAVCDDIPSNGSNLNCDNNVPCMPGLPDPYDELDDASKQVVDSITDMGFSRGQVARTVKHLGTDEKKVVDHLCQIQSFEESGYDSLEAEAALHLHDYNREQAKKFLDLVNQFQDLGFEKNAVKKALVQNKNDWNKTIDALLP